MSMKDYLIPTFVQVILGAIVDHRAFVDEGNPIRQEVTDNQTILKNTVFGTDIRERFVSIMFEPVNWHLQRRTGEPTKHGVEPTIHIIMTQFVDDQLAVEDFYYFPTAEFQLELASTTKWIRSRPSDVADDIVNFLLLGRLPQQ